MTNNIKMGKDLFNLREFVENSPLEETAEVWTVTIQIDPDFIETAKDYGITIKKNVQDAFEEYLETIKGDEDIYGFFDEDDNIVDFLDIHYDDDDDFTDPAGGSGLQSHI